MGTLLNCAERENPDILWFKMLPFKDKPNQNKNECKFLSCNRREDLYAFMFSIGGGGVCVNFYKRDLLQRFNLKFAENIRYSEDVLFHFTVLLHSAKCVKTDSVYYHYRQRPGSAMRSNNSGMHAESMYLLVKEYDKLLGSEDDMSWRRVITDCRDRSVRALIFSLVASGEDEKLKVRLSEYKDLGFYPYKFRIQSLYRNNTYKQFLINLFSFLFPWRSYAMFMAKCIRIIRK